MRKKRGISTVLGTVIGILIFFTIIIPTWIYMQQLQTMFFDQVNRRLHFEAERLRERLELVVSIGLSGATHYPTLNITNVSPLEVTVLAIYMESNIKGLVQVSSDAIVLPPGGRRYLVLRAFSLGPEEVVRAIATTARGNSFFSANPIGPKNLPHFMVVSLGNLTVSTAYKVTVRAIGDNEGCVLPYRADSTDYRCMREVFVERFVKVGSIESGHEEIFAFNVAPGVYSVTTEMQVYDGSGPNWQAFRSVERIVVLEHSTLRINDVRGYRWRIPLQLNTFFTPVIFNTTGADTRTRLNITFVLTYNGSVPGPALDATVRIEFPGATCDRTSFDVKSLRVGEVSSGTFQCSVDTGTPNPRIYTFKVFVTATPPSGFEIDPNSSILTREGRIKLCAITEVQVITGITTTSGNLVAQFARIKEVRCPT